MRTSLKRAYGLSDFAADNDTFYFYDHASDAAHVVVLTDSYPQALDILAGSGTSASSASKPVASISTLATYLLSGFWQFNNEIAHHWAITNISYNISGLTSAEQTLAQSALNAWHEVANLTFTLTTGTANITFNHSGTMTAFETDSYNGSGIMSSATVDISADWVTTDGGANDGKTGIDSYAYQTYIHEIGHALGLGHQGPYNGSASYASGATYANDTWQYSVMSYFSQQNYDGGSYRYVVTPQMADIYAVQSVYGAATTRAGDTVYGFNATAGSIYSFSSYSSPPAFTIYDSGGTDTLDCSNYSAAQTIDLRPGDFSSIGGLVHNIGISTTTLIENAIGGSGNDTFYGNSADNIIDGRGGTDTVVLTSIRSDYLASRDVDGTIHLTDKRSGSPDGSDTFLNIEYFMFTSGLVAAGLIVNHAPVLTVPSSDVSAAAGHVFALSSWISATDSDSDPIYYYVYDNTPDANSGHFIVNGVAQAAQQSISLNAAQFAQASFQAGAGGVSDDLFVIATDGVDFSGSAWSEFHVNATSTNHAPTLTVQSATVTANPGQALPLSWLFSAGDADGDRLTYYVYDNNPAGNSGHFMLGGVAQPAQQSIALTPEQYFQASFQAASSGNSDDLYVIVTDGTAFSGSSWSQIHIDAVSTNHAPVITIPSANVTANAGQDIPLSSLFAAADADNDTLTYFVYDNNPAANSGSFIVNGAAQPAQQSITLTAAQLAQSSFHVGSSGVTDNLFVIATDGKDFSGSSWSPFSVTAAANHAPVMTVPSANVSVSAGQAVAVSSLFSASDADNDTLTYYVYDNNPAANSGHFVVGGVTQPAQQSISLTAAQFAQATFVTGASGVADDLFAIATDGHQFSGTSWSQTHLLAV